MDSNDFEPSFEQQLNTLEAEMEQVLAEAEQMLLDFSGVSNDSGNANPVVPADNDDENNSDVEEIVNEIPIIDLLDSTIDLGVGSEFIFNYILKVVFITKMIISSCSRCRCRHK